MRAWGLFLLVWAAAATTDCRPAADPAAAGTDGEGEAGGAQGDGLWFPVGETIEYKIYWGKLPVARATATTEWAEEEDGRRTLAIRFRTKSNRVLSAIYPVDDFIESIIDPETFLPLRFTKRLSEGRYRCDEMTTFDHANGTATLTKRSGNSTKQYAIHHDTRDLVSFMYAMRKAEWEVGTTQEFQVMADEKIYDLAVKTVRRKKVELPRYGEVESVLLEPEAAFQGLFVRKGKMRLWVSEDDRRVITRADIKVPVASVHLVLHRVTGPGDDTWTAAPPEEDAEEDEPRRERGRP